MKKLNVGIIGTGNIGTDILIKIQRSPYLQCTAFVGNNPNSKNLEIAKKLGVLNSSDSIDFFKKNPSICQAVFECTSAEAHKEHAPIFKELGIFALDLTPARVGKMCVPSINLDDCLNECNVNLITCGGQASVPIANAISKVSTHVRYIELVASLSSLSAGPGTRANIDEFTQTTRDALKLFTKADSTKAIIILNPSTPPINMKNTIYALIDNPDIDKLRFAIHSTVKQIQKFVPGYKLLFEPYIEDRKLITSVEVTGQGDFLPKYAGNLDIITCAAVNIAEAYARKVQKL